MVPTDEPKAFSFFQGKGKRTAQKADTNNRDFLFEWHYLFPTRLDINISSKTFRKFPVSSSVPVVTRRALGPIGRTMIPFFKSC